MKSVSVVFGERTLDVGLGIRSSAEFRRKLKAEALEAIQLFEAFTDLEFNSIQDFMALLKGDLARQALDLLAGYQERLLPVLYVFPILKDNADWIEDEGDDEQLVSALGELAKAAFPFEAMVKLANQLGLSATPTSKSLPGPNGESGETS